jgi:hypothetical protein
LAPLGWAADWCGDRHQFSCGVEGCKHPRIGHRLGRF